MKDSVAVAKEAAAKKGVSPAKSSDKSIQRLRDEHERQLGSLMGVIGNIRRDGGKPSVESIATELGSRSDAECAPALLALQQTHGNQYVQRVVAGIQAKLVVGQPGDIYEQEADRVADEVMRMPESQVQWRAEEEEKIQTKPLAKQITPVVQRQVRKEEKEEKEILQTKEHSDRTYEVSPDLESRIQSLKGGGQPLPESVRIFFEPRFNYDFSQVRVHTDGRAADTAQAMNARAFTTGKDIVFGAGLYSPETETGKRLLAHELVHVVQQQRRLQYSLGTSSLIQTLIDCDDRNITGVANGVQLVTEAHNLAIRWARAAYDQLDEPVSDEVQRLLNRHFGQNPNRQRIRDRFNDIITRLDRGTGIYLCNSANARRCRGGDEAETDVGAQLGWTNLCPPFFNLPNSTRRALTLIHEAAHNAGAGGDVYIGDNYPGNNPFNNAESYGQFAFRLGMRQGILPFRERPTFAPPVRAPRQ